MTSRAQVTSEARPFREPWTAPPELARSIPREVQLTSAGRVLAGVAVLLLAGALGGGVTLYVAATRDLERTRQRGPDAVVAEARVVATRLVRGERPRRIVTYEYVAGGEQRRGSVSFRQREWAKAEVGSRLEIRYLPSEPETSWVPGHEATGVPVWSVPLLVLPMALGALMIFHALRRDRDLLACGRPVRARVTGARRVRHSHSSGYRVQYEFTTLSGATRFGSFQKTTHPPEVDALLTILYDPDEPKRQARYPMKLVRPARPPRGTIRPS